jgi:hypothetical protein
MTMALLVVASCNDDSPQNSPGVSSPASMKPVQVYILAGGTNMLHPGRYYPHSKEYREIFLSADPAAIKAIEVSFYEGAFDPKKDYDKIKPKRKVTSVLKGLEVTPFPPYSKNETAVSRFYIEVDKSGPYKFAAGGGNSRYIIMTVDGKELFKKLSKDPSNKNNAFLTAGKRHLVKIIHTKEGDHHFYLKSPHAPGTLAQLVHINKRSQHLVAADGEWSERKDVYFYEARNKKSGRLLKFAGNFGPELQFGFDIGDFHDERVLLIKSAKSNRALAWDYRPPSSGKLPDIPEELKKWEGLEYKIMVKNVKSTLKNIHKIMPDYENEGYEIAGFVWLQGVRDVARSDRRKEYEKNLVNLINDVRAEFKLPQLPIVVGSLGHYGEKMDARFRQVYRAQMAVDGDSGQHPEFKGSVKSVDTRPFWRSREQSPNKIIFRYYGNAETFLLIGGALAKGMIELKMKNR